MADAAYHRERRAKMRAQGLSSRGRPIGKPGRPIMKLAAAKPAAPVVDRLPAPIVMDRPLSIAEKRSDAQLEAIEARGGTPEWTGKEWREPPKRPPTPPATPALSFLATAPTNRNLTVHLPPLQGEVIPPPRSMIADGGTPPRRYAKDASVAEATALIRAYAADQARINDETARRLAALERYVVVEERNKATKAAGVAKWAEAQRLFFNMLWPQPL
jgi:hypothetical protein